MWRGVGLIDRVVLGGPTDLSYDRSDITEGETVSPKPRVYLPCSTAARHREERQNLV